MRWYALLYIAYVFRLQLGMEAATVLGPAIWLDLSRRCQEKIQSLDKKNEERNDWVNDYFKECKKKLQGFASSPNFVPKVISYVS